MARERHVAVWLAVLSHAVLLLLTSCCSVEDRLALDFRDLPMSARRLTGPLLWLHGDESPELLTRYVGVVAEGGNGCFTAESRPHEDWLGPGWYRDLAICLDAARRHDLKMWIFDERWWPSGEVAGRVPREFGSKYIEVATHDVTGPGEVGVPLPAGNRVAVVAGRLDADGVEARSLLDLTGIVDEGEFAWTAPPGKWRVLAFYWRFSEGRRGGPLVDGASRDAVQWYLATVYQPHYDRFPDDFGRTIAGYFYDEPETHGDWGTEVIPMLEERGVDWKAALVAWKDRLSGEDQAAYRYQYRDALAEAWGRTLYGGIDEWCRAHGVISIGHFLEHANVYLSTSACAGNLFQLQKYSSMGGIDAVFDQFVMGRRIGSDPPTWQTPKLGSSISHAYGKEDDVAMVEIFGARGQDLTYREMKWWTDHMQVSGINFHIPHSFNPRSPHDRDCPPYFYNNGEEPRWPLYRVYADYTSRLSLMLSGGRHVCPVAFLFLGQSFHEGESIPPDGLTTSLQDALFDCDWLPYDVLERDVEIDGPVLRLRDEAYRALVVPAVEVIPFEALARARDFFEAGGVVIGYGILPTRSATPGISAARIDEVRRAIWGERRAPGAGVCRTSTAGGRSYFLPAEADSRMVADVLTGDAGLHPTLEVLSGDTEGLLHVLHRVKDGRDVFFVCNQQHVGPAKPFELRLRARGTPEIWDPMRNELTSVPFRSGEKGAVDLSLVLAPLESLLVVFRDGPSERPGRLAGDAIPLAEPRFVERLPKAPEESRAEPGPEPSALANCGWVWFAGDGAQPPEGVRYFRGAVAVDSDRRLTRAWVELTVDNDFQLFVGGEEVGRGDGGYEGWRRTRTLDLTGALRAGRNVLALRAVNFGEGPNPAGVIGCYRLEYDDGSRTTGCIDASWRAIDRAPEGWTATAFDDGAWPLVREIAGYGGGPWGRFDDEDAWITRSPITADPFEGRFAIPAEWVANGWRIHLEMEGLELGAAAVRVNGEYAGGVIGAPFRLDVTDHLRGGENALRIEPRAPRKVRLLPLPSASLAR